MPSGTKRRALPWACRPIRSFSIQYVTDTNLRARSTSEIVDAAFALYRQNFLQYVMVTAVAYAPVLILSLLNAGALEPQSASDLYSMLPVYLVSFVTMALITGVVSRMGSDVYMGREADVARTLREVAPRVPVLVVATLINAVLLVLSALFLFIPALWVYTRNFAVATVIVLEKAGPFAAFSRSGALTKGRKWHIFKTLLLVFGIYLLLSFGLLFLARMTGSTVVTLLLSSVFSVFAYPVVNLVTMVLYYDCRIRNEGFDLEHMTQALGSRDTAPAY